jgi:ribosomal protein L32
MWRQLSGSEKFRFVGLVLGLLAGFLGFILGVMIRDLGGWLQAAAAASVFFMCVSRLNKLAARARGTGAPQTDTTETRPVSRVKANDGYFKKCAACGKFTRDAKVCRNCGRDLTDRVHRR